MSKYTGQASSNCVLPVRRACSAASGRQGQRAFLRAVSRLPTGHITWGGWASSQCKASQVRQRSILLSNWMHKQLCVAPHDKDTTLLLAATAMLPVSCDVLTWPVASYCLLAGCATSGDLMFSISNTLLQGCCRRARPARRRGRRRAALASASRSSSSRASQVVLGSGCRNFCLM